MNAGKVSILIGIFFCLAGEAAYTEAPEGTQQFVHLRGSSSFFAVTRDVAEAFMDEHPDTKIVVSTGGTSRGIKAVIDGTADIGVTSSLISEEQAAIAEEKKIELETIVVARGAVVPIVHPSNPVKNLSMIQLQRIFSGQITDWQIVGGREGPIKLTSNEATRGAFETWKRCVMGKEVVVAPSALVLPPKAILQFVADNPDAIGYMSFADVTDIVKPLSIDGIYANVETVSAARFPVRRDHALVIRKDPPDIVRKLIAYFLDCEKGQVFVVKSGSSPVNCPLPTP